MRILLVVATELEIKDLLSEFGIQDPKAGTLSQGDFNHHRIDLLITGVGMSATSFFVGKFLSRNYDLMLNVGIAGAFDEHLSLGEVVVVGSDFFSELGAENNDEFIAFDKMNLPGFYKFNSSFTNQFLSQFKQVNSCTVNSVHGNLKSIQDFISRFPEVQIESMEGASCAMGAQLNEIPFVQIRAISNKVEPRNTNNWNIPLALKNLHHTLKNFLSTLP